METHTELVLIPHPNELKKLLDAQRALCVALTAGAKDGSVYAPCLPLYVRGIALCHTERAAQATYAPIDDNLLFPHDAALQPRFACVLTAPTLSNGVVSAHADITGDGLCGTGTLPLATRLSCTAADAANTAPACAAAATNTTFVGAADAAAVRTTVASAADVATSATLARTAADRNADAAQTATAFAPQAQDAAVSAPLPLFADLFPLRLPVFRIAEVRFLHTAHATSWEVRRERWIKAPKP